MYIVRRAKMKAKLAYYKLIGKKVERNTFDHDVKGFLAAEEKGLIEGGHMTVHVYKTARLHLIRAWGRGYENFSVTYVPSPAYGGPVSGETLAKGYCMLSDYGVKFSFVEDPDGYPK